MAGILNILQCIFVLTILYLTGYSIFDGEIIHWKNVGIYFLCLFTLGISEIISKYHDK